MHVHPKVSCSDRTVKHLLPPTVGEEPRQLVHLSAEQVAAQRGGQRLVSHLWTQQWTCETRPDQSGHVHVLSAWMWNHEQLQQQLQALAQGEADVS